ncbi:hypothetical protein FEM08_08610 [Flavobacterium gilvum]|nr:hypothetical protein FEM08_08610 [Flavobacterium gilvum]
MPKAGKRLILMSWLKPTPIQKNDASDLCPHDSHLELFLI